MIRLTRIACKFSPPTLAVVYVKPGDNKSRVKELDISRLINMHPEEAIGVLEDMHPWIFTKTNGKRETFVRVFAIAQRGYIQKMEQATRDQFEAELAEGEQSTDDDGLVTDTEVAKPSSGDQPFSVPSVTLRDSIDSKRSRKSSGSRDRYGRNAMRASLSISSTFEHGLLSTLALASDHGDL